MKFLRKVHLYLGCLFAPMLIFFAVSGSWQLFNWHESTKDNSYVAPRALAILSDIHKDAHIPPTPGRRPTPLRYFMLAAAIGLIVSAVLGVIMAYRFSRRPMAATICLLCGILVPGLLLWIYK
jgi:ABC-type nitrate/sulfonate/bicarbonate transport system permease component